LHIFPIASIVFTQVKEHSFVQQKASLLSNTDRNLFNLMAFIMQKSMFSTSCVCRKKNRT